MVVLTDCSFVTGFSRQLHGCLEPGMVASKATQKGYKSRLFIIAFINRSRLELSILKSK